MQDVVVNPTAAGQVSVTREFLDTRIGQRLSTAEIAATLDALGFDTVVTDDVVEVRVPTWRSTGDVSLPDDVLEELARIHGYDRLPSASVPVVLRPVRSLNRVPVDRRPLPGGEFAGSRRAAPRAATESA
jgi:phenylalanyl-tRNA synthetase beta chain